MLKLIGALMIVAAGGLLGLLQSARYRNRPVQIRSWIRCLQKLETEIGYGSTPLPLALSVISGTHEEPLATILKGVQQRLQQNDSDSFQAIWQQTLQEEWHHTVLGFNEKSSLLRLGEVLGRSDRQDQLKHLRLTMQQLETEEDLAREEQQRYESMWRSLGFLAGALVVVLML